MNATDYLTLPAGRELDALVAERAMGWTWDPWINFAGGGQIMFVPGTNHCAATRDKDGTHYALLPQFSTDIAAAWLVVEKLDLFGSRVDATGLDVGYCLEREPGGAWVVRYRHGVPVAQGATAPLAICRAALLAVSAA